MLTYVAHSRCSLLAPRYHGLMCIGELLPLTCEINACVDPAAPG